MNSDRDFLRASALSGRALLLPLAFSLVFCAMILPGLGWGIPSRQRNALEPPQERALKLPSDLIEQSWQVWGSRGRGPEGLRLLYPRSLFNPVRSYHPDEYLIFKTLSNMNPSKLDFDPKNYIYPAFHYYLCGVALKGVESLGLVKLVPDLDFYFENPDEMGKLYLVTRSLSLLCAVGIFFVVFLIGRELEAGSGLWSLLCLLSAPVFLVHSHYGVRDMLVALCVSTSFLFWLVYVRSGRLSNASLGALFLGLAMGTHYIALVLWLVLPAVFALRREWKVWVSLPVGLCAFALSSPYTLIHLRQAIADFLSETPHISSVSLPAKIISMGWTVHFLRISPAMFGTVAVLIVGGLALIIARINPPFALILFWFAIFYAVVGLDGRDYSRYYLPVVPCASVIGGLALAELRRRSWKFGWLACAMLVLPAFLSTLSYSIAFGKENTRTEAGKWIRENIEYGRSIAMLSIPWQYEMPPLDPSFYQLFILEEEGKGRYDITALEKSGAEYFVCSTAQIGKSFESAPPNSPARKFWEWLFSGSDYKLIKVFSREVFCFGTTEDMSYLNPRVYIFKRRGSAPPS